MEKEIKIIVIKEDDFKNNVEMSLEKSYEEGFRIEKSYTGVGFLILELVRIEVGP